MVVTVRFAICFLTLILVGGTAALLPPEWANDLCLSEWAPDNPRSAEQQRARELEDAHHAEVRRLNLRLAMTRRVINRSATLFEAAALFHQLNQEMPHNPAVVDHRDCSPEEAACCQVIAWVRRATEQEGDGHVRRLEDELRRHKERYGRVVLSGEDGGCATGPCDGFAWR